MGTIAEALVATAIGLLVAIPAVAAFNFFSRKVKSILTSGDTISHVVLAHLKAKDGHVAAPAPAKKSEPKSEPKHENVKKGEKGEKSEKSDKTEQSESKKSESSESKKD